jgi:hypothetical protein
MAPGQWENAEKGGGNGEEIHVMLLLQESHRS